MSEDIKRKWWIFHHDNPTIYELFKRFTFEVIERGHNQYSSKAIFERIRWHTDIETNGEEFNMSNNYTPYDARFFMYEHPQYEEFFRTRILNEERG